MRLCFSDDYLAPPTRLIAILTDRSFLTDYLAALPVSTESQRNAAVAGQST